MSLIVGLNKCVLCKKPIDDGVNQCPHCAAQLSFAAPSDFSGVSRGKLMAYTDSYQEILQEKPNDNAANKSIALCYLMLQMYDEAYTYFMKATVSNYDDADAYYYAAVCMMKGKKAFLHTRPEIDKCLELLNAAISVDPKGIYYYYMAYIKYDYFKRKFLITKPDFKECLLKAKNYGCTMAEVNEMYSVLGVEKVNMV